MLNLLQGEGNTNKIILMMSKDGGSRPHEILVALAGVGGAGYQPTYGGGYAGQCCHQIALFLDHAGQCRSSDYPCLGTCRSVQHNSLFLMEDMQVSVCHWPTSRGEHACQCRSSDYLWWGTC